MYRRIISNGDLLTLEKPWYHFFKRDYSIRRNLSEEVRTLKDLRDEAMFKYKELAYQYVVASKNVGDDLETLQLLLLDNSEAYFECETDQSILEEREGVKYNFGSNNKKGQSSSNKEQNNQQNQQKQKQNNQGKNRGIPVSKLLGASIVLH